MPDHGRRDAEPRGGVLDAVAGIDQRLERLELIGGMHCLPHLVLGKANLGGVLVLRQHVACDRRVFGEGLLLRQQLERGEASASGDDFECAVGGGPHLQVLQQALGRDVGGEFLEAVHAVGFPHVVR